MIFVFDLDDTLYEEITFVKSGFLAVAKTLSKKYNVDAVELFNDFIKVLTLKGRGLVFNDVLKNHNIYSINNVKSCVSIYRNHTPKIKLFDEAVDCLERLKGLPLYIVTDGNKIVQRNKVKYLKLNKYFKKIIPTHQYGIKYSKPSTFVFHKIISWENSSPKDLVYIGDNPNKDFVNLNQEGFHTIRVLTGMYKEVLAKNDFDAKYTIKSLGELTPELFNA